MDLTRFLKEPIKKQIRKIGMVRELEMDKERLTSEVNTLKTENHQVKTEKSYLEKDFSDFIKLKFNIVKDENKNLKTEIEGLNHKIEGLKQELSESHYSMKTGLRGNSADEGKVAVIKYILENVNKNARILDVGFGSGVYGKLLRAFYYQNIDGVDVYGDNIKELALDKIYDNIYIENILDFDFEYYDLMIFGDVLEHIKLEEAKNLLSRLIKENKCGTIVVSIPYEYEQGEVYGNPYEKHLQPDATRKYMEKHYPYLELIDESTLPMGGIIAVYIWEKENQE